MESALEQIRKQFDDLTRRLGDVEQRLQHLESGRAATPGWVRRGATAPPARAGARTGVAGPPEGALSGSTVALVGRTLVVLGGAYGLRALSDREWVPVLVGAGVALLYAAAWLIQCARSAAGGRRTSALFHGVTGLLIAYPLVCETTLVFERIDVAVASGLAVAILALGLGVAWRSRLDGLAAFTVLAHATTCFVLMGATRSFLAPTGALLASAAALEVASVRGRWRRLRWPVALGADLGACGLVSVTLFRAGESATALPVAAGMTVLLALPAVYLAGIGVRTLRFAGTVSGFEIGQAATSLLVGLGGALRIQLVQAGSPVALGAAVLLLAGACYAAAFTAFDRPDGCGRNFHAFTSFALALSLLGWPMLLSGAASGIAIAWSTLAVLAIGLAVSFERIPLAFHGVAYAWAAALASGLVAAAADGLVGDPAGARPVPGMAVVAAAVATGGCAALLATRSSDAGALALLPQSLLGALVVWTSVGFGARALTSLLPGAATSEAAAAVATGRTLVISASAVALAWAARRFALRELGWLVHPVLAGGAAKLLWEDLAAGDPVALFLSLGAYGGALIAVPRLLLDPRRRVAPGAAPEERTVGQ